MVNTTTRVSRAVNPHRKLSLKQIRAGFGGKRRQSAVKRRRVSAHSHRSNPKRRVSAPKKKRRVSAKRNAPRTRVVYRTKYKTRTQKVYVEKPRRKVKAKTNRKKARRSQNPPWLLNVAPVGNPQRKRRKTMAATKKRRRVSAKSSGRKRSNPARRRSRSNTRHRSRNPLGQTTGTILQTGFGVVIGVVATKTIPRNYPSNWTSSPALAILSTALTAGALAWVAARFKPGAFANGVLWGGAAQTISVAVNAFAPPSIASWASLGDFVPGGFPLPQNSVRYLPAGGGSPVMSPAQVSIGSFGRAW